MLMKILSKAAAILVSMEVLCVFKKYRLLNWNEFYGKVSLSSSSSKHEKYICALRNIFALRNIPLFVH